MTRPARLVLFDIDGTLIRGGSFWKESYDRGFRSCLPERREIPAVSYAGKTDPQICRETLEALGCTPEEIDELTPRIIEAYLAEARGAARERAHEVRVLPGVPDLLERLHPDPRAILGVLTGNVRDGAALKLELASLDRFFTHAHAGAWGCDHPDRYRLPAIAVERVRRATGFEFRGKEIVIIGDTVHDVNCGRSLGVRTIAVGTGRGIRKEELLAQGPDFYFDDLTRTEPVLEAIFREL